jgi:hypothetical protein
VRATTVNDISVLPDKPFFYIGGDFTSYNEQPSTALLVLNPNGNIDTTFAVGAGPNITVNVIQQVAGGKILIRRKFYHLQRHGGPRD